MRKESKSEAAILRQKAEELMKTRPSKAVSQLSESNTLKLIHELEVHQIELEIQNAELELARSAEKAIADKYIEIFDFAPSVYFTLSLTGDIIELNHSAANMLGKERSSIKNTSFELFVTHETRPAFHLFLEKVFTSKDKVTCEVSLSTISNFLRVVHLTGIVTANGEHCFVTVFDVTESKQGEYKLSDALIEAQRFRMALDHVSAHIYMKDAQFRYVYANKQTLGLFGCSAKELVGCEDSRFFPPNTVRQLREVDSRVLQGTETAEEIDITDFEGVRRVYWEIKAPIYADSECKTVGGLLGISTDITERKLMEEKLQASEKRFRAIFDQAPIAIALIDLQGHPIISNLPFSKMLGYSSDELTKMTFTEFTHPEDIDKDMVQFANLITGKTSGYSMEKRYIHKNGNLIWANLVVAALRDNNGKLREIFAMVGDITEKKQAEEKLINSEERFKILFDYAPDAYYLNDLKGTFIDGNIAAVKMLGYDKNEMIGKNFFKLNLLSPIQLLKASVQLGKNLLGKATGPDEFVLNQKNGSKITVEISTYPIKIQDQSVVLGIARDITGRKLAEKEIQQSEKKFRSYIDNAPDGVFVVDETGRYIDANNAACTISGYSRNELLKMSISDILAEVSFKDGLAHFNALIKNGKLNSDLLIKHKDGSVRWWSLDAVRLTESRFLGFSKDITERKKAEKELQESELRFRTLYDNAKIGLYRTTFDGNILMANKALIKMLGYSSFEKLAERNLEKEGYGPTYQRKEFLEMIEKDGVINDFECAWVRLDGSVFFVRESAQVIRNSHGEILYYDGIVEDITERKQAETEIAMLAHSLKSISECVSITDMEDKILFVNESFLKTYGYETNELIGKNISMVRSKINKQEEMSKILPTTIKGEWQGELWNTRKDGTEFQIYLSTTVIKDKENKILGLIGVATNITERKRAEETLIKLSSAVEQTVDSIMITDREGTIEYVNHAFEVLTGYSPKEALGKTPRILKSGKYDTEYYEEMWKTILSGQVFREEVVNKKKNGDLYYEQKNISPIFDKKRNITHFVGIGIDVTARKIAEAELIEAKNKAEESNRLKSAFLANMSHEVRTPLNSIIGFSELLTDSDFNEDQKNEFIQHIIMHGNNLLSIISDIMDISKIESGEITIRKSRINAQKFISFIKEQFAIQAEEKKLELILNLPDNGEETIVFADEERLNQIFNNLISNALKFTQKGSIEIGYQLKGKMIEFFVRDSGIGIPTEYHDTIFERFRQVEDSKTRKYGGNGLGLAITKNLIELMGGIIWIESESGKGSVFYFTLPAYL